MSFVRDILFKEIRLSASPLTFLFILFGLMFLIPGYPVLCGAFFVTLGIFYSFQTAREANDIVYSALLPIAKKDVVKGKFAFVCLAEGCAFVLMTAAVVLRMTVLSGSEAYRGNAMMNANFFALGAALLIFGLFNLIFMAGFFRTGYKFGKPFVLYTIACFVTIFIAEALHHIPGLEGLNAFGTEKFTLQLACLLAGAAVYAIMTLIALKTACRRFEAVDL